MWHLPLHCNMLWIISHQIQVLIVVPYHCVNTCQFSVSNLHFEFVAYIITLHLDKSTNTHCQYSEQSNTHTHRPQQYNYTITPSQKCTQKHSQISRCPYCRAGIWLGWISGTVYALTNYMLNAWCVRQSPSSSWIHVVSYLSKKLSCRLHHNPAH